MDLQEKPIGMGDREIENGTQQLKKKPIQVTTLNTNNICLYIIIVLNKIILFYYINKIKRKVL